MREIDNLIMSLTLTGIAMLLVATYELSYVFFCHNFLLKASTGLRMAYVSSSDVGDTTFYSPKKTIDGKYAINRL